MFIDASSECLLHSITLSSSNGSRYNDNLISLLSAKIKLGSKYFH